MNTCVWNFVSLFYPFVLIPEVIRDRFLQRNLQRNIVLILQSNKFYFWLKWICINSNLDVIDIFGCKLCYWFRFKTLNWCRYSNWLMLCHLCVGDFWVHIDYFLIFCYIEALYEREYDKDNLLWYSRNNLMRAMPKTGHYNVYKLGSLQVSDQRIYTVSPNECEKTI